MNDQAKTNTTTTAGRESELRLADLAITLENARTVLHALSPADAITAVDSILQGASASLDHVTTAPTPESAPKLAPVDAAGVQKNGCTCTIRPDYRALNRDCAIHGDEAEARKRDGLFEAQQTAEGAVIALDRLDATVGAMSTSDADEDLLRACLFSVVELIRPIRAEAQRAHDLVMAQRLTAR